MKDAREWLEDWVDENLKAPAYVHAKSSMQERAAACVAAGLQAGFEVADLKEAADGDLERFLVDRQNAMTDAEVSRFPEAD